jgi:hypothetical protein
LRPGALRKRSVSRSVSHRCDPLSCFVSHLHKRGLCVAAHIGSIHTITTSQGYSTLINTLPHGILLRNAEANPAVFSLCLRLSQKDFKRSQDAQRNLSPETGDRGGGSVSGNSAGDPEPAPAPAPAPVPAPALAQALAPKLAAALAASPVPTPALGPSIWIDLAATSPAPGFASTQDAPLSAPPRLTTEPEPEAAQFVASVPAPSPGPPTVQVARLAPAPVLIPAPAQAVPTEADVPPRSAAQLAAAPAVAPAAAQDLEYMRVKTQADMAAAHLLFMTTITRGGK